MNNAYVQFTEFFDKQGWNYRQYRDKPVIHLDVNGKNARWMCVAVAREDEENIGFFSLFPSYAPAAKRMACAELLTRINYGLKYACFELDFDDGEIRLRTSHPAAASEVTAQAVEYVVFANLHCMDHFYGAIMGVLHGGLSPKAALTKETKTATPTHPRFELN